MFKIIKKILIFFFIITLPIQSQANDIINLNCIFYESYFVSDQKILRDRSTVDIQITLIPSSKRSYLSKTSAGMLFCTEFRGSYTDTNIFGKCNQVDSYGVLDDSDYDLNRYSGEFVYTFKTNGKILSINKAKCTRLSKKF